MPVAHVTVTSGHKPNISVCDHMHVIVMYVYLVVNKAEIWSDISIALH